MPPDEPQLIPLELPNITIEVNYKEIRLQIPTGPNLFTTVVLPENMVKDMYSQLLFEQREQAKKDRDIVRVMRNHKK